MEPVELPSFAERARQQEARRAQVLAQRQAERDAKRQAKAKRSSLNSTDATYDPSDYAARRQKAIEQARRAEAADIFVERQSDTAPGMSRQHVAL